MPWNDISSSAVSGLLLSLFIRPSQEHYGVGLQTLGHTQSTPVQTDRQNTAQYFSCKLYGIIRE